MSFERTLSLLVMALFAVAPLPAATGQRPFGTPTATLLVAGLEGGSGSTVGPGEALYVPEPVAGRISRVDPRTGEVTTLASGLPQRIVPTGGVMDVAFIGATAYALVTLVGPDVGGSDIVGIYRVDGPSSFTVIADLGTFSINNPPDTAFVVPTGVQYALDVYRGAFLVTDGHHNRVLHVTLDGQITEFRVFDNIVPTGLVVHGHTVYMAEAGAVPHEPEDGKVVSFGPPSAGVTEVASGARLAVDVEFGRGRTLYVLSQGIWDGVAEGSPALPGTGSLMQVNADGSVTPVVGAIDRPTSMEIIGNTAYVINLVGEIWKIDNVSPPPYGLSQ